MESSPSPAPGCLRHNGSVSLEASRIIGNHPLDIRLFQNTCRRAAAETTIADSAFEVEPSAGAASAGALHVEFADESHPAQVFARHAPSYGTGGCERCLPMIREASKGNAAIVPETA